MDNLKTDKLAQKLRNDFVKERFQLSDSAVAAY